MAIQKSLGLRGKSEFAGARKVLAKLKRSGMLKGAVKLMGNPAKKRPATRIHRGGRSTMAEEALRRVAVRRQLRKLGIDPKVVEKGLRSDARKLHALRAARTKAMNPRRARNIAGFMRDGVFHPIRSGERMTTYRGQRVLVKDETPYSRKKAGERPKRKRRNTTYASFQRQGRKRKKKKANPKRMTKKQLFLRRMRLGRLRAARARAKKGR